MVEVGGSEEGRGELAGAGVCDDEGDVGLAVAERVGGAAGVVDTGDGIGAAGDVFNAAEGSG